MTDLYFKYMLFGVLIYCQFHRLDRFPPVTFQFDKSVSLTLSPQEYLFELQVSLVLCSDSLYCPCSRIDIKTDYRKTHGVLAGKMVD